MDEQTKKRLEYVNYLTTLYLVDAKKKTFRIMLASDTIEDEWIMYESITDGSLERLQDLLKVLGDMYDFIFFQYREACRDDGAEEFLKAMKRIKDDPDKNP